LINNKEYIGSDTKNGEREKRHLRCVANSCDDCGGSCLLHKAIKKYGLENFDYFILEAGFESIKAMREAEYLAITERRSLFPSGYNIRNEDGLAFGSGREEQVLDYLPPKSVIDEDEGTQIIKERTQVFKKPKWADSDVRIRKILLSSFPNMRTNPRQRSRAARWAAVAYLRYRMQMTSTQISEELHMNKNVIKMVIRNMGRAAKGMKASGLGPRSTRPIGRPKKTREVT
jgi:hypothetical protein